jgi:hypothetical protein
MTGFCFDLQRIWKFCQVPEQHLTKPTARYKYVGLHKKFRYAIAGGAARHFSANYMPFAGAKIFVREHACVRAEIFLVIF